MSKSYVPVYSGPDTSYYRSNNGKAQTDLKGGAKVWGSENGWYLIYYTTNKGGGRFGYVMKSGFTLLDQPLHFSYFPAYTTERVMLTEDPDGNQAVICTIPAGRKVIYLATYHGSRDTWYYVEYEGSGLKTRGFIPEGTLE